MDFPGDHDVSFMDNNVKIYYQETCLRRSLILIYKQNENTYLKAIKM